MAPSPRGLAAKFDSAIGRAARPAPETARAATQAWRAALEAFRSPLLAVRGAESNILRATPRRPAARQPCLRRVEVDGVGHAPTLSEPEVVASLDAFYDDAAAVSRSLSGRGTASDR